MWTSDKSTPKIIVDTSSINLVVLVFISKWSILITSLCGLQDTILCYSLNYYAGIFHHPSSNICYLFIHLGDYAAYRYKTHPCNNCRSYNWSRCSGLHISRHGNAEETETNDIGQNQ